MPSPTSLVWCVHQNAIRKKQQGAYRVKNKLSCCEQVAGAMWDLRACVRALWSDGGCAIRLTLPSEEIETGLNASYSSLDERFKRGFVSLFLSFLGPTAHTKLKARDHRILRSLIGRKDPDRPSSLHSRRWRSKSISTLGQQGSSRNALRRVPSMHKFFLGWHSLTVTCIYWLFNKEYSQKIVRNITWFTKVAWFTGSQVDEAPECGRSKSNAHTEG